jgi:hypothetical protein
MDDDPARDDDVLSDSGQSGVGEQLPPREILELDYVYEALSHSRRRYLCYTLLEETEWSLTDLATKIAAWENGIPDRAVTDHQRELVYVSLYHAHIPKLVDQDITAYDDVTETIKAAEHAEQVLSALEGIGASLDADQERHARGETDDEA